MTTPTVAIIVVAAGSGVRLGAPRAKAFVTLASEPILRHALSAITRIAEPVQLIVVAPQDDMGSAEGVLSTLTFGANTLTHVVAGGATRHESVECGLAVLHDDVQVVLVHDAARALASSELFERVIAGVRATGAGVVPALAVVDTLKKVDSSSVVQETVNRDELVAVQTPQGFPRDELVQAYAKAGQTGAGYTDDAATFSAIGLAVTTVTGEPSAFKITTPADLERAQQLLGAEPSLPDLPADMRIGYGADVHAFGEAENLWLAGLHWPGEPELSGHSDGDAAAHALCDAVLSAAALGDIGSVFGTDDPQFANARGEVFVTQAIRLAREAGWEPVNASIHIVGNRPKFAARREEAQQLLAQWIGAPVSVAATTSDGLGLTGEGRGIAAIATVLMRARR